jgi:hypothetical protein
MDWARTRQRVNATVTPAGSLDVLSKREVERFCDAAGDEIYALFRQCALAVLNSGSSVDDAKRVLEQYSDFEIRVIPEERGIKLELANAPAEAFVDGRMIQGIREHLFAVLRVQQAQRHREIALLRSFGASRRLLRRRWQVEFLLLGGLAGLLGGIAASLLAWLAATRLFHFPYLPGAGVPLAGLVAGAVLLPLAALAATRRLLDAPPLAILHRDA